MGRWILLTSLFGLRRKVCARLRVGALSRSERLLSFELRRNDRDVLAAEAETVR